MRRIFATLLCLCLLALPVLVILPAGAQAKPWSTLYFAYDPAEEGAEPERGELVDSRETTAESPKRFWKTVTVSCDTQAARLLVNGELVDSGSQRLAYAGSYEVKVQNRESGAAVTYYLRVMPELDFESGHVFVTSPVIACANAVSVVITKAGRTLDPQLPLTELGEYRIQVRGISDSVFEYTVYVRYCKAEPVLDPVSGKRGILVSVGAFDGLVAELDGAPVAAGETLLTAVGQHTLTAQVNGEPAASALMPSAQDLLLQVRLELDALEAKEPFDLDLTPWNAAFYLDGERVEGKLRLTEDGEHILTVRDASGAELKGMILLKTGADTDYRAVDSVTLTFRNPHKIWAIVAAVPAVLLCGAAIYFLLARRRVV